MRILLIGSGGREHALAWKISQSDKVDHLFVAPGNAGTAWLGTNVDIKADDLPALLEFALAEKINLTIVGPEVPLALGIVDLFKDEGLPIFGPTKKAAQIEASKVFAKVFMKRFNIPTADFKIFSDYNSAKEHLKQRSFPCVVKADGLAAGKGVYVCRSQREANRALVELMVERRFGAAGDNIIIEDCLTGQEASVFCLSDGRDILLLLPAQDHKAIGDGDKGPNTGGMGAYAPAPLVDEALLQRITADILKPTIKGMAQIGCPFKGVLFAGLMLTEAGPQALEFNCRFGDPETQPQMALLRSDLVDLMTACVEGRLRRQCVEWHPGFSVCVVLASEGYPGPYEKGFVIEGLNKEDTVFHAGTRKVRERVLTNGGRVLGVTACAPDIKMAIREAYAKVDRISFVGKYYRTDIGAKACQ